MVSVRQHHLTRLWCSLDTTVTSEDWQTLSVRHIYTTQVLKQSLALCNSSAKCLSLSCASRPTKTALMKAWIKNRRNRDGGFYQTFPAEYHPGRHASTSGETRRYRKRKIFCISHQSFFTDSQALTSWFSCIVHFPLFKLYMCERQNNYADLQNLITFDLMQET